MSRSMLAGVAVLAALLAGCARPVTTTDAGEPARAPLEWHDAWTSCATERGTAPNGFDQDPAAALGFEHLPAGAAPPAAVVLCAPTILPRAGGGEDMALVEQRATDLAQLIEALRLPDQPMTTGACTADLVGVVWFAVLDAAGRWTRPGVSHDPCGKPRIEVRQALERLTTTTVATTVLSTITSDEAAKSGCGQAYAELVGVVVREGGAQDTTFDLPTGEMRACVYSVAPQEQGTGKPRGDFVQGGRLRADQWAPLRTDLLKLGPPVPCTANASRFALIGTPDNPGGTVSLELDGCHRLLIETRSGSVLRQGDGDLAQRVLALL